MGQVLIDSPLVVYLPWGDKTFIIFCRHYLKLGGGGVNTLADELELRSQVLQKIRFCSQLYLNDKIRLLFFNKV